ncbi:tumor necrosis factor receptor superfamily member 9 isoform X2 [Cavia porcellus]|uniref:TNF receptor superfamily member 9 n=2 Tax=Cavia porcellus TaxID=10141 RepID=H0VAG8_CAVPO|nr:tumor necrosis factor receptor superfamily member 9 [Cavia porcellus]XP_013009609.1 tumor necrosis factor receptor superfamily member 9 [Cavia porcellus]XP_013009611.1 tumor necrosis factor receptor superfamily member 9 [Cavia porcellus]XP_023421523.1 tumor necrosis factor receptor superfamily member 9 [Cavia porcellus]XP_023421524.1 tumor necrosis factor receptor superfamily member 9 [Cavia porcellus]
MESSFRSTLVAVLLVASFERTKSVLDSCGKCPAGTFCEKNKDPPCTLCPANSYSSRGGQTACDICRKCEGLFRTKKPCSPTSNAECECVPGFRCLGPGCASCHPDCEPGQQFTEDGCEDCCCGTFNGERGGVCRPWTQCSLSGKTVLVNGTKEKDVVCGPVPSDFPPGPSPQSFSVLLVLTSAMVLLLLLLCVCQHSVIKWSWKRFAYLFKRPFMKPVQTAQMEDACSYRFPQEEEGECEP